MTWDSAAVRWVVRVRVGIVWVGVGWGGAEGDTQLSALRCVTHLALEGIQDSSPIFDPHYPPLRRPRAFGP